MSGKAANTPQNEDEMICEANASRQTKVYAGRGETVAINDEKISALVSDMADGLQKVTDPESRIQLRDTEIVQRITIQYVRVCANTSTLPTMSGLAKALGCTRQALNKYIKEHPGTPTEEWLTDFSDTCAEVMMQAALSGSVSPVPAIFIAKSRFNWRDAITIENTVPAPLSESLSPEEIVEKYKDIPYE